MARAATQRHHLRITGTGSASGGIYERVKIVGEGEIEGSIECGEFRCVGDCEVRGAMRAEQVRVTGTLHAAQHLYAETVKIRGEAEIRGNVGLDSIELMGGLTVGGDCEAERLHLRGHFAIGGLLAADTIQVRLYHHSRAKEIGGEKIDIRKRGRLSKVLMPFVYAGAGDAMLTVETIEGDDIYLEYTKAAFVRGNRVAIGPGCDIGTVEYKSSFDVDNDAAVQHHTRI